MPSTIREDLRKLGLRLSEEALQEVLQAAAHCASFLGGEVWLDWGRHFGLHLEIDPLNDQEVFVEVVVYDDEEEDEDVWH